MDNDTILATVLVVIGAAAAFFVAQPFTTTNTGDVECGLQPVNAGPDSDETYATIDEARQAFQEEGMNTSKIPFEDFVVTDGVVQHDPCGGTQ